MSLIVYVSAQENDRKMISKVTAIWISVASLFVANACQPPPAPAQSSAGAASAADPTATAASVINEPFLRAQVAKLSADEFEGRGPGTRGDRAARAYLIEQLTSLGIQPALPGAVWEQPLELVGVKSAMPKAWTFERGKQTLSLAWWDQYIAGSGVQSATGGIENSELVYVGYGIEAPEYGWDDFKGRDVRGKTLLILNNDPDWDPALFAGSTRLYYGRWMYKYENAARHGAAGAIIIHTAPSAGYPFQVVQSSWGGEQFALPSSGQPSLQVKAWVTEDAARALIALSGQTLETLLQQARSRDFAPVALGITTSLHFENQIERVPSANIVGLIPGRDPALANEYVVLSAHHDHLGIGEPDARGDTIYNGALDNGAGVAQVLAIAKAFRALTNPPRRSVLVLLPGAEEAGLLGSRYFTEHLPVPAGKIAANLNYDGGNIWGRTRDITQIGAGKSSLDAVVRDVAAREGRVVRPDQFPDLGTFYRSDQFSFAKVGVPALYLKPGTDVIGRPPGWGRERILSFEAHRYHQPSDELGPDWNFDGMVDDARFGFLAALEVANADTMPTWTPGDEFEAPRNASLTH